MKDDRVYLGHILEAIDRVLAYSRDGEDTFRREVKTQDAIIRNLQVMGEAVKKVSAETRAAHPEIPWRDIAGMRDRVVHDYFGVPLDVVWDVVENHIPPLRENSGWLSRIEGTHFAARRDFIYSTPFGMTTRSKGRIAKWHLLSTHASISSWPRR